jgi:hypothetical protein
MTNEVGLVGAKTVNGDQTSVAASASGCPEPALAWTSSGSLARLDGMTQCIRHDIARPEVPAKSELERGHSRSEP